MRVTVVGGGGFRVPLVHATLRRSEIGVDEIVLTDVDAGRLQVMESVLRDPGVSSTVVLDAALDGADIVLAAMRVGGNDARVRDERSALDLGLIGQETVGAGGVSYALRCVPAAVRLADAVARRAPSAWVISMTNPAGVVTEAMQTVLGDRVIGVCDSPVGLIRRAAQAAGLTGRTPADLDVDYVGLNHLGWLRALADTDGDDALPDLVGNPAALASFEEGRLFGPDLIRALGVLPNEYLYYFYCAHEALAGIRAAGRTRGEQMRIDQTAFYSAAAADPDRADQLWRSANRARNAGYLAELRAPAEERAEEDISDGGYEGVAVALASALTGGAPTRLVLNVANAATIPQLPADAVIETVCAVDRHGAKPLPAKALTPHQIGLTSSVKAAERAAIGAARTGSLDLARQAFAIHPLVGSARAADVLSAAWAADRDLSPPGH